MIFIQPSKSFRLWCHWSKLRKFHRSDGKEFGVESISFLLEIIEEIILVTFGGLDVHK